MLDFAGVHPIFTHPGQPQMQVEIILASRSTVEGAPAIYTIRMRYPRIIHGEIMTHRLFSRNARSSRAVPVKTMLLETTSIPFVPWHWGANQKGMQAGEECNARVSIPNPHLLYDEENSFGRTHDLMTREEAWLWGRDQAVAVASALMEAGYHKQVPNRLLEAYSWMDTLITSTDWANFLWLRDHEAAEPHLRDLAVLVQEAIDDCVANDRFQTLEPGEWHQPYITAEDLEKAEEWLEPFSEETHTTASFLNRISAARCARISYKPFDGDSTYERELERYNGLVTSDRVHASPLEHQATPDRCVFEWGDRRLPTYDKPHLAGNLGPGWIQHRKLIPNERHYG